MRTIAFALVLALAASTPSATSSSAPSTPGPTTQGLSVGSDGSDGVFNPQTSIEINLGLAPTGPWTDVSTSMPQDLSDPSQTWGNGIYDPDQWAVVFKFASMDIPPGVDVTFKNHPSRAPVVLLSQSTIVVAGKILANGAITTSLGFAEPGPGGFRGGIGSHPTTSSDGFGPGGSGAGAGGSHQTSSSNPNAGTSYGSAAGMPLVGGSGAGAGANGSAGGAGGGAVLLAANETLVIAATGHIEANGGTVSNSAAGEGAGGLIRLVAEQVTIEQGAQVQAFSPGTSGPIGGLGRVRIESALAPTIPGWSIPAPSTGAPGPILAPAPPVVRVVQIELGQEIVQPDLTDPRADFASTFADVMLSTSAGMAIITVEGQSLPPGTSCQVRITPTSRTGGTGLVYPAPGDPTALFTGSPPTAVLNVPLSSGVSAVQARAILP